MFWLILAVAFFSTGACIYMWFRDVRRTLTKYKSTVESAESQLLLCRKKALDCSGDSETAAILERSEKIYRQAVEIYNSARNKPYSILPAFLMGFKYIS